MRQLTQVEFNHIAGGFSALNGGDNFENMIEVGIIWGAFGYILFGIHPAVGAAFGAGYVGLMIGAKFADNYYFPKSGIVKSTITAIEPAAAAVTAAA